MLNNLLLALPYLFDPDNPLNIPASWNKWLWYIVIAIGVLFMLMIIVLFFKAVRRTRQRREARERAKEEAAAKKAEDKAVKDEAKRKKKEKPVKRVLTGITLDPTVVQRNFVVGDEFNCDGLLVTANYNAEPLQVTLTDYKIVKEKAFEKAEIGKLEGLFVCKPEMKKVGKRTVYVCFNRQVAMYTISVVEKAIELPKEEPKKEEKVEVAAVVAPAPAPAVEQPTQPVGPREMISLTVNTDYVRRDFFAGDSLTYEGLIVNAHYNREPFKEQVYNYTVIAPDMSKAGNPTVVVMYQDRATSYTVTVRPNPYAQQQQQHFEPYAQQPVQQQPVVQKERVLTRVSVNSDFVKKDYVVGDTFSREGLMVTAHYNVEPLQEQVTNFTVIPPDMRREGMATVMVAYQDRMVSYQINVRPAPVVAKPEPIVAPVVEQPKAVRELQSVTLDTGVVQREFEVGEEFNCDGLLVNGNYSLAPTLETYADYNVVDAVSFDQVMHADVTGVYVCEPDMRTAGKKVVRVCLNKHIALYTISIKKATAHEPQPQPPVLVETQPQSQPQPQPQPQAQPQLQPAEATPIVIEEESYEAKLRYDKSFLARLIQSDNDVKQWYTQLKNKLLSFKTCKGRVSWKRETFKAAKQVVAMLAFRGNTLCLFLPLSAADYEDTRFELEDVSNVPAYSDTPAMFRLKNNKRIRLALELIDFVMDERDIPADPKFVSEDYYMPYEGIVELIEKGLVKREIKTAADEAVFSGGQGDDEEDDAAVLTEVSHGVYVTSKKSKK